MLCQISNYEFNQTFRNNANNCVSNCEGLLGCEIQEKATLGESHTWSTRQVEPYRCESVMWPESPAVIGWQTQVMWPESLAVIGWQAQGVKASGKISSRELVVESVQDQLQRGPLGAVEQYRPNSHGLGPIPSACLQVPLLHYRLPTWLPTSLPA